MIRDKRPQVVVEFLKKTGAEAERVVQMLEQSWSAEELALLNDARRALAETGRIEHEYTIIEQENAALKSPIRELASGDAQSLSPGARALFESATKNI